MRSRAPWILASLALAQPEFGAAGLNTHPVSSTQVEVRPGPALPAAARSYHGAVWDPASERAYVFGGLVEGSTDVNPALDEVWSFHPASMTWSRVQTSAGPSGRYGFGMTWDSKRSRLLVSGGNTGSGENCMLDLWTLDPESRTWVQLNGARRFPGWRSFHGLTYDSGADRAWLTFGNCADLPFRTFDGYRPDTDDWVGPRLAPIGMGLRTRHMSTWDSKRNRLLIYGGLPTGYLFNSPSEVLRYRLLWNVDPSAGVWEHGPEDSEQPEWRRSAVAGYDPYLDAFLVFGGTVLFYPEPGAPPRYVSNELWAYLLGPQRWKRIDVTGLPPRTEGAGVYSPATGEIFVFGGADTLFGPSRTFFADTWIIPIETPARFEWTPAAAQDRTQGAVRWGEVSLAADHEPIENVRLMDCETGAVIETSERVMKVGRGRWKVGFGRATPAEERAVGRGKLVVAGVYEAGTRAFLARLPVDSRTTHPGHGMHDADAGAGARLDELSMTMRRDGAGWSMSLSATIGRTDRVEIVDVVGRVRASIGTPTLSAGEGHRVLHWNGTDSGGQRLPRGVYFVRIPGRPEVRAARVVID